MINSRDFSRWIVLVLAGSCLWSARLGAEDGSGFGVTAAVYGSVRLYPGSGSNPFDVKSGAPVSAGDEVVTGPSSGLQVLLTDSSVFTLGSDTRFVLDRYAYDPESGAGEVKTTVGKGVFKAVTGRINDKAPGSVTIEMPSTTLVLRGTSLAGEAAGANGDTAVLLEGEFDALPKGAAVETGDDEITVFRGGFALICDSGGNCSDPAPMSGRDFGQLIAGLARARGAGGGGEDSVDSSTGGDLTDDGEGGDLGVAGSDGHDVDDLVENGNEDGRCGGAAVDEPGCDQLGALLPDDELPGDELPDDVIPGDFPQDITRLADLEDIAGLKGRFVQEEIEMANGGHFDLMFEFGQVEDAKLDFIGFLDIDTAGVNDGEISWDVAVDGAPTFEELALSLEDGTLTDKGGCFDPGTCEASITVRNAGNGNVAKFFALDLDTGGGDDSFSGRIVKPAGNNNFPQDDPADID